MEAYRSDFSSGMGGGWSGEGEADHILPRRLLCAVGASAVGVGGQDTCPLRGGAAFPMKREDGRIHHGPGVCASTCRWRDLPGMSHGGDAMPVVAVAPHMQAATAGMAAVAVRLSFHLG